MKMKNREQIISSIEAEREFLENKLNQVVSSIGPIPIANPKIMPFGWRKSAKGRTVWRIVEEVITQNIEISAATLGFKSVNPADSEVGVFDFRFCSPDSSEAYVNIKSSVLGAKKGKDDLSKSTGLLDFYKTSPDANLYIATFVIDFRANMTINIINCIVFPISWIPDIYINPSNNGNLQSSCYKDINSAVKRTNEEFVIELISEFENANSKKRKKYQ